MTEYAETYAAALAEVRSISEDRFGTVTWHLDDVDIQWGPSLYEQRYQSLIVKIEDLLGIRIYK